MTQRRRPGFVVLVVDDNPINRQVLALQLERLGYPCSCVGDGSQALAALEAGRFSLVFMDCDMPVMDGLTATGAIREKERAGGGRLPIVATTATPELYAREACLEAGADGYLIKPLSVEQLAVTLEKWDCPLDPRMIQDIRDMAGDEAYRRIAGDFLTHTRTLIGELNRAAAADDARTAHRLAHTLKGSCGSYGASALSRLLADIEQAARQGRLPSPDALRAVEEEFQRVQAAMKDQAA